MPRRLIYAREASDDLQYVRGWLTQAGSGKAARRTLSKIRAEIRRLQESPCLWAISQDAGTRELPAAGGYRVIYEVIPDTGNNADAGDVYVLRVFGPGQTRT